MIDFLNTWAQKIIVVVIICTIIEMIISEGKNKKYIKIIIGIYVVFTIISPIISKINSKDKLDLEKYLKTPNQSIAEASVNIDNTKYIEEIYKERIISDIKAKIHALDYEVKWIDLEIETKENETYGTIKKIDLKICKKHEEQENKITIQPVIIGKEDTEEENELTTGEIEKVKTYLCDIYYIDKEKIVIN